MTKKDFIRVTTYAAVFGLVGGVTFQGTNWASQKLTGKPSVESPAEEKEDEEGLEQSVPQVKSTNYGDENEEQGVSKVAASVLPSIVAIDVTVQSDVQDFFGRSYTQEQEGSGSGIIVAQDDEKIYVATNNHVVADASKVSVKFQDESVHTAVVKGTDSDADLAVVEIPLSDLSDDTKEQCKVAVLGDSDEVQIGEQAIAIGNALGYGTSVTVGYISAKEREVASEDVNMKLLQTDAAINPGNSGGALVDDEGKVIGINSAKYSDTQVEGMGFAIPISTAIPIINDMIKAQNVPEEEKAALGIRGGDVSSELSQYYGMPEGIYVAEVTEGSAASKAGIVKGDFIVAFNDRETKTMESLQEKLGRCRAGDEAKVTIKRMTDGEYKEKTVNVTLGKKSDSDNDSEESSEENSPEQKFQ